MSDNLPVVGFVGMTHLGLVSGICAASKGFHVRCIDPDPARIERLQSGVLPVSEPGLDELLRDNAPRLEFSTDVGRLQGCDIVYVAPDVATDDDGGSDLSAVDDLLGRALACSAPETIVVVLSQVPPGYTRGHVGPARQLFYQVETLVFGRAVERSLHPERFIVGCADPSRPLPANLLAYLHSYGCPILPMRLESAELAKISINLCLVASISVANTLAELCERIDADWTEIAPALKLDRRIGEFSYLSPGLGIAGGNLERDLATVCALAARAGTDAGVVRAQIENSRHRRDWALRTIRAEVFAQDPDATLAVLGLAYKENTHSIKNSPALALLAGIDGRSVRLFDPQVDASTLSIRNAHPALDELDACDGARALAIMTPWPRFRALDPAELAARLTGNVVVDPYCVLDPARCRAAGLRQIRLGAAA